MAAKMNSKTKQRKIRALKRRDGPCCRMCRSRFSTTLKPTIDHIKRLRDGGSNALYNLRLLCLACNQAREP